MFLDKYGIKMHFSINLCGVEDSMENFQTYLISWCAVMVFESYTMESLFFYLRRFSESRSSSGSTQSLCSSVCLFVCPQHIWGA